MTLTTAIDKSEVLKWAAINYKSDIQDLLAALSSYVMKIGKWDDEFNKLFSTLSMAVTDKTQDIEHKADDLSSELAKVG